MNPSYRTKTCKTSATAFAALAAGAILFTGCFQSESASSGDPSGSGTATIEGRVQGDAELGSAGALGKRSSTAGVEGAAIAVMRIKADGSLETVSSAEVKTDAQGRFSVKTEAGAFIDGTRELIVRAKKEGREWKAVVSGKVKQGATVVCRPLTVESSVEAEVLAKVRAQSGSAEVSFADVASHIDADISSKVEAKAEAGVDAAAAKAAAKNWLAAQIGTEAKTRTSVLVSSAGKFTLVQMDKVNEARMDAEAKLEADLNAAIVLEGKVSGEAKAKVESDRQAAEFKAWTGAGIALGELAKAKEVSYKAAVQAGSGAAIEADTKLAWMRKVALDNAVTLEAALKEDVKTSGGQSDITVSSGISLKASLNAAKTEAEIDSAFASFRASVTTGLKTFVETALGGKVLLSESSKARMDLKASLTSAVDAEAVAEAYRKFYLAAEAEIKSGITAVLGASDSDKVGALTRTALLIGIQGDGGGKIVLPGFTLSGKVEGNVSGANVQVATVKADGTLEILANVSATTDAQGGFTLNTDTKLPDSLVVVVTKNEEKLMILVDSATSKPVQVGAETTLEARLAQTILKGGTSIVTQAEINSQVDSGVAADVKSDDSAMAHLMASLEIAAQAKARFLLDAGIAVSGSAEGKARSLQVYAQTLARFTAGISARAKYSLIKNAHIQAGLALSAAAEAQAKAAGASEAALGSLVSAGVAFKASLHAAMSEEAIASAYASYHVSVTACVKAALVLHAATIESLDAKIRGEAGARAELLAKLKSAADAEAAAMAHAEFAVSVEAQVVAAFKGVMAGPGEAQVKAVAQALILANMGG